ncbi:MAG TPA: outer membrane beta-barrel protein, partial [Flavisolibacter sp.]|nr:outer membrane beta-barrel protein [Flavisolibacter sp.]
MRIYWLLLFIFFQLFVHAQSGTVAGTVVDEKGRALESVTVQLIAFSDSTNKKNTLTDKSGSFLITDIPFGYYKLRLSYISLQSTTIDSMHFRAERADFNLADILLKPRQQNNLDEIIIYAEKPLIQSKDGNITFNAGESALSQGSNASDLLTQVPLITKDPDGKVLVRGKEPKILIDDKPVELNLQQLQDLLESMPGSSIEKIEVMTNPPPQYANEQGGVINITTRKGSVGISGRLSLSAGSRGETGGNGSFSYRKNGLSLNVNAGIMNNNFQGNGYSVRQNIYSDSSNFFKTANNYANQNLRPNFRANIDYEITKSHLLNFVLQYNQGSSDNTNGVTYKNLNRFDELYRLSHRAIRSSGSNYNPNVSLTYTFKTKSPGEVLRIFANYNYSGNTNERLFYQQFLSPDYTFIPGNDSTQLQVTDNIYKGYNIRFSYDRPLFNRKTFLSLGSFYTKSFSDIDVAALYKRKGDGAMLPLDLLSNSFLFKQYITNFRGSVKQLLGTAFSFTAGASVEETRIHFDLLKAGRDTSNSYWTVLPFANLNRTWANNVNLTFSYRRTLRRPGINELNPTRDFSDPYNIRSGNPGLLASPAHNFDLVIGKNKGSLYTNLGIGYNSVEDIYNQIRTLLPNGTTEIIWQNISGRKEYEASTWSGYTFNKKLRLNISASYTYNVYSDYDKKFRRFRNGGSLTSNLNTNYTFKELYTATGNFTFNRFANPQGTVRSNVSMNLGLQAKLLNKKLTLTLNFIDPFTQQQNRSFTYGNNFALENYSTTQTRNYRL